jgi:prepilin-type N-terminal cleavage/methylation domain-containing protein
MIGQEIHMQRFSKEQTGFTLLELIIVLVAIGILIALIVFFGR